MKHKYYVCHLSESESVETLKEAKEDAERYVAAHNLNGVCVVQVVAEVRAKQVFEWDE